MMKLSVLVVTTAAVLLLVSTPTEGNGNALKKWVDKAKGKVITIAVQHSSVSKVCDEVDIDDITFIRQSGAIMAGKTTDGSYLTAFASAANYKVVSKFVSPTNYLPWAPDKAIALLLDSNKWGDWFLTAPLSERGCDVWIADHDDYEPLVIRVNANDLSDNPVESLQYKQRLAFQFLGYFNKNYQKKKHKFYRFVQRVSYNYAAAEDDDDEGSDVDAINEYWNQFTKDTNIPFSFYLSQSGFFYGYYSSSAWHFALKDLESGKLLLNLDCENPIKSMCTIM